MVQQDSGRYLLTWICTATSWCRSVIICNPNNPLGTAFTEAELACDARISRPPRRPGDRADEIWALVVYGSCHVAVPLRCRRRLKSWSRWCRRPKAELAGSGCALRYLSTASTHHRTDQTCCTVSTVGIREHASPSWRILVGRAAPLICVGECDFGSGRCRS